MATDDQARGSLSLDRIVAETFVAWVDHHDQLESTNDRSLALLAERQPKMPCLVLAERQTAGRGRGENQWWASPGALTFSLILEAERFQWSTRHFPQASLTTGLATCETLLTQLPGVEIRLKWPNDVYLQGRKVCGILVETAPACPGVLVVGIGINVNNSLQDAPPELRARAISLVDSMGRSFDRTQLLIRLLNQLERHFQMLTTEQFALAGRWRELCFLQGRTICIESCQRQFVGVCHSIDDEGALLLRNDDGIQRFFGGEVRRIM